MEISCIYIVWCGSPFLSGIIFFGQLSRKRFIGNDVVVVVFYEGNTPLQLDFGGFIRMRPLPLYLVLNGAVLIPLISFACKQMFMLSFSQTEIGRPPTIGTSGVRLYVLSSHSV